MISMPSPKGEGGPQPAPSPAGAGRVRGRWPVREGELRKGTARTPPATLPCKILDSPPALNRLGLCGTAAFHGRDDDNVSRSMVAED